MTAPKQPTDASRIEHMLGAGEPVTITELCLAVYGKNGPRERNAVHQRIYRLTEKKRIRRHAARFELAR